MVVIMTWLNGFFKHYGISVSIFSRSQSRLSFRVHQLTHHYHTRGVTSGAGTAYCGIASGTPEFTHALMVFVLFNQ